MSSSACCSEDEGESGRILGPSPEMERWLEMAHRHEHERFGWIGRFAQWLFGSPFRSLPPTFGDQTPPELRVFEVEVDEARHDVREVPASPAVRVGRSKPARRK